MAQEKQENQTLPVVMPQPAPVAPPQISPPLSVDLAIQNCENALASLEDTFNIQDTKALFVAASASALVAIVVPLFDKFPVWVDVLYLIFFLNVLGVSYLVYKPRKTPIAAADPLVVNKKLLQLPEDKSKPHMLDILEGVYEKHTKVVAEKGRWLQTSFLLLGAFLILSIGMMVFAVFNKGNGFNGKPATPNTTTHPTATPKPAPKGTGKPATAQPTIQPGRVHGTSHPRRRNVPARGNRNY